MATLFLIISSTLIIFLLEYANPKSIGSFSLFDKILSSYFIAINYRTAGFNTLDMSGLHDASLFFGSLFMVIGGAPGGTAGGMKITTVVVLLFYAYWSIRNGRVRIFQPRNSTRDHFKSIYYSSGFGCLYSYSGYFPFFARIRI